jgi:hypothetical protein
MYVTHGIEYRFGLKPEDLPKPETDAELEIISEIYFGKALHLRKLSNYCSYEVEEDYNSYHGEGYEFSECNCKGYDHSAIFWRHILGQLYCGGIARASYGQYKIKGYRNKKRIDKWIANRRNNTNYIRPQFARLANRYGVGESRMTLDSSALTCGRVDGA